MSEKITEKKVKTRIQNKHDLEKNWKSATFPPLPGELIIYDAETEEDVNSGETPHLKPRVKIGDGETPVGDLPFVIDVEATEASIAAVADAAAEGIAGANAKASEAIAKIEVDANNPRKLNITTVGGTQLKPIITQDTNDNNKVYNTPKTNTKAYITATPQSSSHTDTQIFDTGVYLGTEAGALHATTFYGKLSGTASKATSDGNGNNIVNTYETKSAANSKLAEAKGYTDSATEDMNKEAYLTWGGRCITGGIGPLAAALSDEHSANRLAYLNPNAISVSRSTDTGATWSTYPITNAKKTALVTTSTSVPVGVAPVSAQTQQTSIQLTAMNSSLSSPYLYVRPRKLLINVDSPHALGVTIRYARGDMSVDTWNTLGTYSLSGWSAWNEVDISDLENFGGNGTQTSNVWRIRLDFYITAVNSSYPSTVANIFGIRMFADKCWSGTSNLGTTGHLYSYDANQNATFPAKVTATTFAGSLTGKAQSATRADKALNDNDGNEITETYATKEELANEADPTASFSNTIAPDGNTRTEIPEMSKTPHNIRLKVESDATGGHIWCVAPNVSTKITSFAPYDGFSTTLASMPDIYNSTTTWLGNSDFNLGTNLLAYRQLKCRVVPEKTTSVVIRPTSTTNNYNDTYTIYLILYSPSLKKSYFVRGGSFYYYDSYSLSTNAFIGFYFDSTSGTLYMQSVEAGISANNTTTGVASKNIYSGLPADLVLYALSQGETNGPTSSSRNLDLYTADLMGLEITGLEGFELDSCIYNTGEYLLATTEKASSENSTPTIGIDNYGNSNVTCTVTYLRDSGHLKALKHIRECTSENLAAELPKIISKGTADPDADTPGLFYFKYI